MEVNNFVIDYQGKGTWISLVPVGDIHLGDKNCDVKYFEKLVDWVLEDDKRYVIGMGDYGNYIVPSDASRYDSTVVDIKYASPEEQFKKILKTFQPLAEKNKIIGFHTGNHEEEMRKRHYFDFTRNMCHTLKVPYLGWNAITSLSFNRLSSTGGKCNSNNLILYSTHGFGSGFRRGSKVNKLEDLASFVDADIYLMGHNHDIFSTRTIQLRLSKGKKSPGKIIERKRVFACTGTMLRGYAAGVTSYIERKGYQPHKIGVIKVKIKPYTKDIHVSE